MAAEYKDMSLEELSSSNTFAGQLEDFKNFCIERADQIYYELVIAITNRIIDKSPVDTGRFKANWQYSVNAYGVNSLNQYDISGMGPYGLGLEESYSRVDAKSDMRAEINGNRPKMGDTVYIYNNLIYSVPLEYGWSTQAPNGVVRTTLAFFNGDFTKTVGKLAI